MPRPRFAKLDEEKRTAILDAAEEAFAQHGFAGASYNHIIVAAGVSKGAMYYYFDDKADLFLTVLERRLAPLGAAVGAFEPAPSPEAFWGEVAALLSRVYGFFLEDPRAAALVRVLAASLGEGDAMPGLAPYYARLREVAGDVLTTGQRVGAVRTDLPHGLLIEVVLAMGEATDLWLARRWEDLAPDELAAVGPQLLDLFQRVCTPA